MLHIKRYYIGDFRADETSRRTAAALNTEYWLNRTSHFNYLQPEEEHKDCALCSNRKIKGREFLRNAKRDYKDESYFIKINVSIKSLLIK